jgi:polysaccharide biosynthesis/export protein
MTTSTLLTRRLALRPTRLGFSAFGLLCALSVAAPGFAQSNRPAGSTTKPSGTTTQPTRPSGTTSGSPTTTAAGAQQQPTRPAAPPPTQAPATPPATAAPTAGEPAEVQGIQPPADYVLGPGDVIEVVFFREKDLSADDVTVRPDGMISLALVNDIRAAGLTPVQLRTAVMQAASKYVTDPSLTIVVKQINSRRVYVTGQVNKPGTYPLHDTMTVLQMLAVAGGLMEFASGDNILVMREENGETKSFKFNYKDIRKGKNLQQNIALKPGDTIIVP